MASRSRATCSSSIGAAHPASTMRAAQTPSFMHRDSCTPRSMDERVRFHPLRFLERAFQLFQPCRDKIPLPVRIGFSYRWDMSRSAVLALVLGSIGCNQVFGIEPLG